MFWLNILDNEVLHLVAETAAIVIGSILMGILLGYLYWGAYKKRVSQLNNKIDFERNQVTDLNIQLNQLTSIRNHLVNEMSEERSKYSDQAKTIYDQNQRLYKYESQFDENKRIIDQLNATIKLYESRLEIIEHELTQTPVPPVIVQKPIPVQVSRANYEHVSNLLGKQVIENDLTLIQGIGPRTALLLQSIGIGTWETLGKAKVEDLRKILTEAGGNYRSIDPTHWPKQAVMAAQSEWRKLRVFQETLRKV